MTLIAIAHYSVSWLPQIFLRRTSTSLKEGTLFGYTKCAKSVHFEAYIHFSYFHFYESNCPKRRHTFRVHKMCKVYIVEYTNAQKSYYSGCDYLWKKAHFFGTSKCARIEKIMHTFDFNQVKLMQLKSDLSFSQKCTFWVFGCTFWGPLFWYIKMCTCRKSIPFFF